MKDIQPIPAKVYDQFEKANPQFLVVGIQEQIVHPQQLPQAKFVSFHVGSLDELMYSINREGLKRFRVYQVNGTFGQESELRRDAEKSLAEQTEAAERKEFERLKAKFESKMAVV